MPYLLDGDNLVGTARRRPGTAGDRHGLISEIADRLRRTRATVILFFDGAGRPLSLDRLSVRFAGAISADDAIVRELSRSSDAAGTTVVTADRDLARRAREAGAAVMPPPAFWSRFGAGAERKVSPPREAPVDVDEWLDWFSDESNRQE